MAFEPAGKFLFTAAKQFHMAPQALSGIMCAQAREVIGKDFESFLSCWEPTGFETHTLTIKASSSAARSALYMNQMKLVECFLGCEDLPAVVKEVKIV